MWPVFTVVNCCNYEYEEEKEKRTIKKSEGEEKRIFLVY
jgi:hypothetical protein